MPALTPMPVPAEHEAAQELGGGAGRGVGRVLLLEPADGRHAVGDPHQRGGRRGWRRGQARRGARDRPRGGRQGGRGLRGCGQAQEPSGHYGRVVRPDGRRQDGDQARGEARGGQGGHPRRPRRRRRLPVLGAVPRRAGDGGDGHDGEGGRGGRRGDPAGRQGRLLLRGRVGRLLHLRQRQPRRRARAGRLLRRAGPAVQLPARRHHPGGRPRPPVGAGPPGLPLPRRQHARRAAGRDRARPAVRCRPP